MYMTQHRPLPHKHIPAHLVYTYYYESCVCVKEEAKERRRMRRRG
jgi:hypothetical protein